MGAPMRKSVELFWAAAPQLEACNPLLPIMQHALDNASAIVTAALQHQHPVVADSSVPLADKLTRLPTALHAAACSAAALADNGTLALHVIGASSAAAQLLQRIAAALPRCFGIVAVSMTLHTACCSDDELTTMLHALLDSMQQCSRPRAIEPPCARRTYKQDKDGAEAFVSCFSSLWLLQQAHSTHAVCASW
jgi:hypothetical protein